MLSAWQTPHAWQGLCSCTHPEQARMGRRQQSSACIGMQHNNLTSIVVQLLLVHGNDVGAYPILHRQQQLHQQLRRVAQTFPRGPIALMHHMQQPKQPIS